MWVDKIPVRGRSNWYFTWNRLHRSQYGKSGILLSLRFYVKPIFGEVNVFGDFSSSWVKRKQKEFGIKVRNLKLFREIDRKRFDSLVESRKILLYRICVRSQISLIWRNFHEILSSQFKVGSDFTWNRFYTRTKLDFWRLAFGLYEGHSSNIKNSIWYCVNIRNKIAKYDLHVREVYSKPKIVGLWPLWRSKEFRWLKYFLQMSDESF